MPGVFTRDLELFIDHVVPELQRRGLFRTAYGNGTLRDRLGLKRPVHAAPAKNRNNNLTLVTV